MALSLIFVPANILKLIDLQRLIIYILSFVLCSVDFLKILSR